MLLRSEFQKMRSFDMQKYGVFLLAFAGCVVGRKRWSEFKESLVNGGNLSFSEMVTATDEAFVHLALENSWNKFLRDDNVASLRDWEFTEEEEKAYKVYKEEREKETDLKKRRKIRLMNKYSGDIKKVCGTREGVRVQGSQGWSDAGKLRFNELVRMVKKDRQERGVRFDVTIKLLIENEYRENNKKKRKLNSGQPLLTARIVMDDDLSDSD